MLLSAIPLLLLLGMKYKPIYKVSIQDIQLGYVSNKSDIEKNIDELINNSEKTIAFVIEENLPKFELVFNSEEIEANNEQIIEQISNIPLVKYKSYAIVIDEEETQYVNSFDEATEIVDEMKSEISEEIKLTLGIREIYTDNTNLSVTSELTIAKANAEQELAKKIKILGSTVNDVTLSTPIKGVITSRYGAISRIRSSAHTGLDIANALGTPIKAAAKGTVKKAEYSGSYGNLVIIEHENGVETYYAHCSKIYAKVGDIVDNETTIATVGSTGNSTGPHLHFEIRVDGETLNPQKYLYKD